MTPKRLQSGFQDDPKWPHNQAFAPQGPALEHHWGHFRRLNGPTWAPRDPIVTSNGRKWAFERDQNHKKRNAYLMYVVLGDQMTKFAKWVPEGDQTSTPDFSKALGCAGRLWGLGGCPGRLGFQGALLKCQRALLFFSNLPNFKDTQTYRNELHYSKYGEPQNH